MIFFLKLNIFTFSYKLQLKKHHEKTFYNINFTNVND